MTKEECESMFHCLSAGLKGMQTCHGFDIYSIITRWEIHFGIPKLCFNDLGIVITMKKFDNKRIVTGIYELEYNDSDLIIREFFVYNPFKSNWEKRSSLNESKMFRQITTIEALSEDAIEDEINQISNHLNGFVKRGDFLNQDIKGIIQLFEKFDLSLRRKVTNNEVSEYLDDSQLDLSSYADDSRSNWFTIEEKGRE